MRTLEHRRHSRRDPVSIHLSDEGRALARAVGATLPPFDRVVTSPKPRAIETAEALGGRWDGTVDGLGQMPDDVGVSGDVLHLRSFAEYVAMIHRSEEMATYAAGQAQLWRTELERVPEGGALLLISHGGVIEFGAASALPTTARRWGPPLGYLEGVRLQWDGQRWVSGEVVRVPG
jgi:broad specificity phosphatase PhoE